MNELVPESGLLVDQFISANLESHSHIQPDQAFDFHTLIGNSFNLEDRRAVDVQVIAAGCLICSAVLGDCSLTHAAKGYHRPW